MSGDTKAYHQPGLLLEILSIEQSTRNPVCRQTRCPLHASSLTSILHYGPLIFNNLHRNTLQTHFFVFYLCSLQHPFTQTGEDRHFVKSLTKGHHVREEQALPAADKHPVLGLFLEQLTYYLMQGLVWMRAGPPRK